MASIEVLLHSHYVLTLFIQDVQNVSKISIIAWHGTKESHNQVHFAEYGINTCNNELKVTRQSNMNTSCGH